MRLIAYTDGSARPTNPGPAGIGVVFLGRDGPPIHTICEPIGVATNNVAEYRAVIAAIEWWIFTNLIETDKLEIRTDSLLVANQVNGKWRMHDPLLRELNAHVQDMIRIAKEADIGKVTVHHVSRKTNKQADKLAGEAAGLNPVV